MTTIVTGHLAHKWSDGHLGHGYMCTGVIADVSQLSSYGLIAEDASSYQV